ncbi:Sau3AI family type II restriction endonuclease, partial [Globicatella sulfidifaciens]
MNKEMTYEELRNRAYEIIGIPLAEIDRTGRLATGKGAVGTVVEESWFGKDPNSLAEPDFESLDIELKVTPYRVNKNNTISSKERLVSNMIDYMEEHKNESFEESSFYQKSSNLLIMFYEYLNDVNKGSFNISHVKFITLSEKMKSDNDFFFLLPKEDIEIMRQDWGIIVSKIKDGKAHEISGSDTNYLEACTKARDSSVRVDQPFSSEKAKPRAFSLKQSYMTFLLNNYVLGGNGYERLIRDVDELTATNFEDVITSRFKPYYGKTDVELANLFDISTKNKGFRNQIVSRIVGVEGNINNSQEFIKASIISKTV